MKKTETKTLPETNEKALAQVTSVQTLLEKAVEGNVPIETVQRLLDMRKELKAEQARDLFFQAVSEFQGQVPTIPKRHAVTNRDGSVRYKYAKLDDITSAIRQPLANCGLSYKWELDFTKEGTTWFEVATCILTHEDGHSERSAFKVPVEFSTSMNNVQSFASAGTYAKRYALCNALGVSPDEDDDAQIISHIVEKEATPAQPATTVQPPQRKAQPAATAANGNRNIETHEKIDEVLEGEVIPAENIPGPHQQAPPPKQRPMDHLVYVETVTKTQSKNKAWKYGVKCNDGFWYNTFSATFGEEAIRARDTKRPILLEWEEDSFGYKINNLEVQE